MRDDFVLFILTHGRPDKILTLPAVRQAGYTGKIILLIDNEDETAKEYYKFEDNLVKVVMFDKLKKSKEFDTIDTNSDRRSIVYARNACFDVASDLGYKYFLELDDDYFNFRQRYVGDDGKFCSVYLKDFDSVIDVMIEFLETSGALTVAFAQTGDFIGGKDCRVFKEVLPRKAMNSFFCKTENRFDFIGRINEDVNTYLSLGSQGYLLFTIRDMSLDQLQTQSNNGGMSELYLDCGTFVKSFFSVICCPSSVKIYTIGVTNKRFHHRINWENAVPKIISNKYKR